VPEHTAQDTIHLAGLEVPWRPAVAIILSTLILTADWYYNFLERLIPTDSFPEMLRVKAFDGLALYLLIPLLVIVVVFREKPADYGFRLGDWRAGIKWTLILCAAATPILLWAGRTPTMIAYYARYSDGTAGVLLTTALELFSWEFLFRGFLLWALYRVAGPSAVLLQAVPFAMAHLSKPPLETLSTIFGGTLFGWLGWRTRSFLYPFALHWFVMSLAILVATLAG